MTLSLTAVRFHTQADPYHYTVDNRPLTDLESRDNEIVAELNKRTLVLDITGAGTPTVTKGPASWTCGSGGTGVYTIAHNIADTSFIVVGTILDASGGVCSVTSISSTEINIKTTNLAGSATHLRFHLLVSRY